MRPLSARCLRAPVLALLTCGLLAAACWRGPQHADVRLGGPIPGFRLPALTGEMVSSDSYRGRPVVLNFWATWCGPCVKEIPTLSAISRGSAARVVTIAIDDGGASVVEAFVARHGIDYTVLLGDKDVLQRFDGRAIPYTLVLDSSLEIVSFHRGYVSLRSLERALRRAES